LLLPEAELHCGKKSGFDLTTARLKKLDETFMRAALREAIKGSGFTSPNPVVGAVVVKKQRVVGRGFHRAAGAPHAEIEAFSNANPRHLRGATLFVTLEPCSTHGRTPPCVDAIIDAGITRVVIGAIDPNPVHAGRAVELLRASGIDVCIGVLDRECRNLNRAFNKWIVTKTPFVIAKIGMSLDARLSRPAEEGRWITNELSRRVSHQLRARVDAILIGATTLRIDDPQLTVRGIPGARQPWRVVITKSGELPPRAKLFTDQFKERTLVYRNKSLRAVLRDLGRRKITSVLIEGGSQVLGEAFDRRLVDQVHFFLAPLLIGGPKISIGGRGAAATAEAAKIVNARYERFGDDLALTGEVEYPLA
jgi:diaminohydroxyphosphoribosylaminopyrimidine deaminase/5-amino-6-(5-phosphoribosylamino)uracil reductase